MSRFPRLVVNENKLYQNLNKIVGLCHENGISVAAVTKCCFSSRTTVKIAEMAGADFIADSRISVLNGISTRLPRICTRISTPGEEAEVVSGSEISLESEEQIIRALSAVAQNRGLVHGVILMLDLGDLREGIFIDNTDEIDSFVELALSLPGIRLEGLGTNLSCFGSVLPDEENLGKLAAMAERLRKKYSLSLPIVSGGATSSSRLLFEGAMPKGITNLRLGECWLTGYDTSSMCPVPGMFDDAYLIETKVIELKIKPSVPIGRKGANAFGETSSSRGDDNPEENPPMRRGICAIGRVDVDIDAMRPENKNIRILGASSDHCVLDLSGAPEIKLGDIIRFIPSYGALMRMSITHFDYGRLDI